MRRFLAMYTATLSLSHKKDVDRDRYELEPSCQLCLLFHLSPLRLVGDFAQSSDCPIHMAGCECVGTCEVPRHTFSTGPWHCRHSIRPLVVCIRQFGRLQSRRNLRHQQSAVDQSINQYSFNWQLTNCNCRQTYAQSKLNEVVTEKVKNINLKA